MASLKNRLDAHRQKAAHCSTASPIKTSCVKNSPRQSLSERYGIEARTYPNQRLIAAGRERREESDTSGNVQRILQEFPQNLANSIARFPAICESAQRLGNFHGRLETMGENCERLSPDDGNCHAKMRCQSESLQNRSILFPARARRPRENAGLATIFASDSRRTANHLCRQK